MRGRSERAVGVGFQRRLGAGMMAISVSPPAGPRRSDLQNPDTAKHMERIHTHTLGVYTTPMRVRWPLLLLFFERIGTVRSDRLVGTKSRTNTMRPHIPSPRQPSIAEVALDLLIAGHWRWSRSRRGTQDLHVSRRTSCDPIQAWVVRI